jgi:hypothetical protein
MSVLGIERGKVALRIPTTITINGFEYDNITVIARLLSYQEVLRLDSFKTSTDTANILVEDDVFALTFDRFLGLPDGIELDIDNVEAGILSTISYAIVTKSIAHILNAKEFLQEYSAMTNSIDSMELIVARYTSTPLIDVRNYPVNVLFSEFALIKKTFPGEILEIDPEEEEVEQFP